MPVLREVRTHIRRSPNQAMAATLTMFLTFLVAGVFFLATMGSAAILNYFEGKPQITVFFTTNAGKEQADALTQKLEATGKVASTHYVSKEDALNIYKQQNKNDPLLLAMVTADILPASLEISAKDPKDLSSLAAAIKGSDGVDEVVYQRDVVNSLLAWTNAIRLIGGLLATLLAIDSLLIMGTVIAMKVALKRDEIEILMLVGASPWSIRAPFILEGGTYGLFGGALASLILIGVVAWQQHFLYSFLGVIPILHALLTSITSPAFLIASAIFFVGTSALGFLLGAFGSWIALIRYLK